MVALLEPYERASWRNGVRRSYRRYLLDCQLGVRMNAYPSKVAERRNIDPVTYAMHRVLYRLMADKSPFAVFVKDRSVSICSITATNYNTKLNKQKDAFVGVYDSKAKAEDILDDLKGALA